MPSLLSFLNSLCMDSLVVFPIFYACAGLGEAVLMRSPSSGEEETQKPVKDKKKRNKRTPAESPTPKRAKV